MHRRLKVGVRVRRHFSSEIEQEEGERRHPSGGDGCGEHPARRARHDQRKQNDHGRDPGEVGQHLVDDVVLPERNRGDDEANRNLVGQPQRVEPGCRHAATARDPPEPGGCQHGRQVDHLKRACLKEIVRRRITGEDCGPVPDVDDEIKRKRNENEQGQEPHASPDLLEHFRRKHRRDPESVRRRRIRAHESLFGVHANAPIRVRK